MSRSSSPWARPRAHAYDGIDERRARSSSAHGEPTESHHTSDGRTTHEAAGGLPQTAGVTLRRRFEDLQRTIRPKMTRSRKGHDDEGDVESMLIHACEVRAQAEASPVSTLYPYQGRVGRRPRR
jgi:hypothetical protein